MDNKLDLCPCLSRTPDTSTHTPLLPAQAAMRENTRARHKKWYTKGSHTLQTCRSDAERSLNLQEGVVYRRLDSEGLSGGIQESGLSEAPMGV